MEAIHSIYQKCTYTHATISTEITEINLSGKLYAQRLQKIPEVLMTGKKSSYNSLKTNSDKLTSVIFVHKVRHLALYHMIPE